MDNIIYLTKAGSKAITTQLEGLYKQRREILEGVKASDMKEVYDATATVTDASLLARTEYVTRKITELEEIKARTSEITADMVADTTTIKLGHTVSIHDFKFNEYYSVTILNSVEEDAENYIISTESSLGKGLLGLRKEALATIKLPIGTSKIKVLDIVADMERITL